jgi:hypothetical protein
MKIISGFWIAWLVSVVLVTGQEVEKSTPSPWNFNAEVNFYFFSNDFILLPILSADREKLHLEVRYNYEDIKTISGWIGYNFSGGNNFEYAVTPMIGGVVGLSRGIAPGLEFALGFKGFELYSESEYLIDPANTQNNFYYNWSDLTYLITDWLGVGISGQHTRLYHTKAEIQRGLLIRGGFKQSELTAYFYNMDVGNPFFLLTLSLSF